MGEEFERVECLFGNRKETRTNYLADLTALWAVVGCGLLVNVVQRTYLEGEVADYIIGRFDRSNGSGSGNREHARYGSDNRFDWK